MTSGAAAVAGTELMPGSMLYLPAGHGAVPLTAAAGTVLMLLGGVPLGERLLMWWNFVARRPEEIAAAVAGWQQGIFGEVGGVHGRAAGRAALGCHPAVSQVLALAPGRRSRVTY